MKENPKTVAATVKTKHSILQNVKNFIYKIIKKIVIKFFEILTIISPKFSAIVLYIVKLKKIPNLKKPTTFNEKTTLLKLSYKNNELVSKCANKYEVREYVKEKGLESILNELYGAYDTVDEIDFDKLPNRFALKCARGSGFNIICNDKKDFNTEKAKKILKKYLKEKPGLAAQELHYLNTKLKIICEKNLSDENGNLPIDYKIYCFKGEPKCILTCTDRETKLKRNIFDLNWNELPYVKDKYRNKGKIEKPENLQTMIEYARKLSGDFEFVRVDFYDDNGKIIFGELTFTPAACANPIYNKTGDIELGKLL